MFQMVSVKGEMRSSTSSEKISHYVNDINILYKTFHMKYKYYYFNILRAILFNRFVLMILTIRVKSYCRVESCVTTF